MREEHDINPAFGNCTPQCGPCNRAERNQDIMFAVFLAIFILAALFCKPCHGAAHPAAEPRMTYGIAYAVTLTTEEVPLDPHLVRHEWPYYPDKGATAKLITENLPGADPKVISFEAGDTRQVSVKDLCTAGSTKDARHVTAVMKRKVFAAYGITENFGAYEIDHFISLELGGANTIWNLWPQPYGHCRYTARMKDVVETNLHRRICKGLLTVEQAQHIITMDWVGEYKKIKGIK